MGILNRCYREERKLEERLNEFSGVVTVNHNNYRRTDMEKRKNLVVLTALVIFLFCGSVLGQISTKRYMFCMDQSSVDLSGGFGGHIHETYSITGQFQLTVDFDTNTASFDWVDANLSDGGGYLGEYDLGTLFYMTELVGTVVSDTEIHFEGQTKGGITDHINCEIIDDSIFMAGHFWDGAYDGIFYQLQAVAVCVYYVDAVNGNDANNGLSPETAFATIQKGIDTARNGGTVIVAEGTYCENINFKGKNIVLTSSDPRDRSIVDNTIIDGNDANSVVTFSGAESSECVVRGFTITDGNAPAGGGICGNGTMATIENNVIINNEGYGYGIPGGYGRGGGLMDCDGLIQNNIITGNGGGGACNCDGTIRNNVISNNWAMYGGGMFFFDDGSNPSAPTIINCTFSGNSAAYGGAISCWSGYSTPTIVNCILWGDWAPHGPEISGSSLSVSFSDVEGGWAGEGNIDTDPCFVDPCNGDYHLQWNSACINVGDPCYAADENECDIDGEPRVMAGRVDMGVDEVGPRQADFTRDGIINFEDFSVFGRSWQSNKGDENWYVLCDLYKDEQINILDLAEYAKDWLWQASVGEPKMVWYVDPNCADVSIQEGGQYSTLGELECLRFTVTVEGSYIHFEDMINANCCKDRIELKMTVEDNIITIREIEHTSSPCRCLCDYPTTAILGPFADGEYLLEVIDVYGNSLGVVEVTGGQEKSKK